MDYQNGYTVEVTGLSPATTEKDLLDFFSYSGTIEHAEIVRVGDCACTGYVTFKDAHSQEIAALLSGATILGERVCITRWGHYKDEFDFWNGTPSGFGDEGNTHQGSAQENRLVSSIGEAVTMTQEVVKTMVSKGYILSNDAVTKAKAFDESHGVSATAAAKVVELDQRIGFSNKFRAGLGAVKSVDQKYHVSDTARSTISATGRTAASVASNVVNSSYFSRGALWLSGALDRAAKATAQLGSRDERQ